MTKRRFSNVMKRYWRIPAKSNAARAAQPMLRDPAVAAPGAGRFCSDAARGPEERVHLLTLPILNVHSGIRRAALHGPPDLPDRQGPAWVLTDAREERAAGRILPPVRVDRSFR